MGSEMCIRDRSDTDGGLDAGDTAPDIDTSSKDNTDTVATAVGTDTVPSKDTDTGGTTTSRDPRRIHCIFHRSIIAAAKCAAIGSGVVSRQGYLGSHSREQVPQNTTNSHLNSV